MCANVDQMFDSMFTRVLTTDNLIMLLSHESTTEQQTTKIDANWILHLGVLHGPRRLSPLCILGLCQWGGFLKAAAH